MRTAPLMLHTAALAVLLGCSDSTGPAHDSSFRAPPPPEAAQLRVSPSRGTLRPGETLQLTATYAGDPSLSAGPVTIVWHSSRAAVATVSAGGLVRGVSGGQALIVAAWGGSQATAVVTVEGPWKKHADTGVCLTAGHPC